MASESAQESRKQLQALFGAGTCAGLTDRQLLERFAARRDEAGELAFEALMKRHGPMVLRVCGHVLDDPNDVHDAFQAVFLVLARRAGAILKAGSVGSWLYAVAVRIAARARCAAVRRCIRDRKSTEAARVITVAGRESHDTQSIERTERAAVVYQEVSRLKEKYRAPVVLCYLEGLTHDEAAARLSCPVGTVRSRLARARDTLRARLARRGVIALAAQGSLTAWLAGEQASASASIVAIAGGSAIPTDLSTSLVRVVMRIATGQPAASEVSGTSLALSEGVLRTMIAKKFIIAAALFLSLGLISTGMGMALVRASRAQEPGHAPASPAVQKARQAGQPDTTKVDDLDHLIQQLVEAAHKRWLAQRDEYEAGRITIDRFVDACKQLEFADLSAAKTTSERQTIKQRHIEILKEIEAREQGDLVVGRGTADRVAEAVERRLQAEVDLKLNQKEATEKASILHRLSELERKLEQLQKERSVVPATRR